MLDVRSCCKSFESRNKFARNCIITRAATPCMRFVHRRHRLSPLARARSSISCGHMAPLSKVAVVIGVGPGIGAESAKKFASKGYSVALLSRSLDKLTPVEREINQAGGKTLSVSADAGGSLIRLSAYQLDASPQVACLALAEPKPVKCAFTKKSSIPSHNQHFSTR